MLLHKASLLLPICLQKYQKVVQFVGFWCIGASLILAGLSKNELQWSRLFSFFVACAGLQISKTTTYWIFRFIRRSFSFVEGFQLLLEGVRPNLRSPSKATVPAYHRFTRSLSTRKRGEPQICNEGFSCHHGGPVSPLADQLLRKKVFRGIEWLLLLYQLLRMSHSNLVPPTPLLTVTKEIHLGTPPRPPTILKRKRHAPGPASPSAINLNVSKNLFEQFTKGR